MPACKISPQSSAVLKKLLTKKIIEKKQERRYFLGDDDSFELFSKDHPPVVLNQEQNQVVQSCQKWLEKKKFQTALLHGVTSSGKTEIYIYLAWLVLSRKNLYWF